MKKSSTGMFANLKNDIPAGIVVFLVAVPLCLGIALASDAPLFSGIIAGMVGGIIVTLFSNSQLGVSGPAAGLAAIVLTAIPDLGGFEVFLLAVFVAGLIQLIFGILKAGIIAYYFPSSVIKGMLAGIGIIIFLKQIPHAFGYDADPEGDLAFQQTDGQNTFTEILSIFQNPDYISMGAVWIVIISLAILITWEQKFIKKFAISQWVQGPLVVVALGIILNNLFYGSANLSLSPDHLVNLPLDGTFEGFLGEFRFPDFSQWNNPKVYTTAAILALVASLETLLCVEATDKLDPQKRITPTNQELRAQGIGNMISGLIGGLPITQVIVRSSANIQSGGKTRMSAFIHGILILICVLLIPNILNMIPLASLAAILLVVGYKLAKPALFKAMYRLGWLEFTPFLVTILGIVFTDLLVGIGLGMAVAGFFIFYKNYQKPYIFNAEKSKDGETVHLTLPKSVSFLNKGSVIKYLTLIPNGQKVILDASKTFDMHPDVLEIIHDFEANAITRDIQTELIGFEAFDSVAHVKEFEKTIGLPNQK
jgi:MFS superfamily sulfate permease-like transporter